MILQIQQNLRQFQAGKRLVVGVSGGADSVCLALILKELGYKITIAHLNHGLRGPESEQDAAFVKKFALDLHVPCVIKKTVIPRRGNLENNARQIRYAFLEEVRKRMGADAIAVAHHRDDQVETVLMHLARGAGLRGIAGMQVKKGLILRPLLAVAKHEILAFLKERNQSFRHDKSNENLNFLRNRLRHMIIPHFQKENPFFKEEILEISQGAGRELVEVSRRAQNWLQMNNEGNLFSRENFSLLSPTIKGEVIIGILGTRHLYSKHIHALIRLIERGKSGRRMTLRGVTFTVEYDRVSWRDQTTKRLPRRPITTQGIKWGPWKLQKNGRTELFVRPWLPGDRFKPAGLKGRRGIGTKKVQDYFTDAKIPFSRRPEMPIIVNSKDEILAIADRRLDERGKRMKLNQILKITSLLMLGLLFFPTPTLAQETSERTTIQEIPSPLNVILRSPSAGTQWLLKMKPGCSTTLEAGKTIRLGVRGGLNGKNDYLEIGDNRRCDIEKAFEFNAVLTRLNSSRNRIEVEDEAGAKWTLFAENGCEELVNFSKIYAFQGGPQIAKGDVIYLHGEPKKCSLKLVEPIAVAPPIELNSTDDREAPTQVDHVFAVPRNGKAFLYWRPAQDNRGVDHYVVSYSPYSIDPLHMTYDSAENKTTTKDTRFLVENLKNDRDYYFYVMAVDEAGNRSSLWSRPAHARLLSSISPDSPRETGLRKLNLRLLKETGKFFFFQWDAPPTATRFMISVTLEGKPILVIYESPQKSLRVRKTADRAGKPLVLEVSAFNLKGFIEREKVKFGF